MAPRRAGGAGTEGRQRDIAGDFQTLGAKGLKMVGRTDETLKCAVEFHPSDRCFSKYLNCTQFSPNMKVMDGC